MGTNTYTKQKQKSDRFAHIINSTITTMINVFYETSLTDTERQAVIETAQDFGFNELSDVLIERFDMNK